MAAELLNRICGEFFHAQSAGLEPGTLNPLAVEALQEIGIDAGVTKRLHWPFPDPSQFTGTHEEKMARTREVLEQIRAKIENFCEEHCALEPRAWRFTD